MTSQSVADDVTMQSRDQTFVKQKYDKRYLIR